jgi:hypothetical protein
MTSLSGKCLALCILLNQNEHYPQVREGATTHNKACISWVLSTLFQFIHKVYIQTYDE